MKNMEYAQLVKKVMEIVEDMTEQEVGDKPEEKTFEELGIDSLMALELAVHLEREFGVRLDERELAELRTLGQLLERVQAKA